VILVLCLWLPFTFCMPPTIVAGFIASTSGAAEDAAGNFRREGPKGDWAGGEAGYGLLI
jgi:hypothetical protein